MDTEIEETLKRVAANPSGDAVAVLKANGRRCAECNGHVEGVMALRKAAAEIVSSHLRGGGDCVVRLAPQRQL